MNENVKTVPRGVRRLVSSIPVFIKQRRRYVLIGLLVTAVLITGSILIKQRLDAPKRAISLSQEAESLASEGNIDEAVKKWEQAYELSDDAALKAEAAKQLAISYFVLSDRSKAESWSEAAIEAFTQLRDSESAEEMKSLKSVFTNIQPENSQPQDDASRSEEIDAL